MLVIMPHGYRKIGRQKKTLSLLDSSQRPLPCPTSLGFQNELVAAGAVEIVPSHGEAWVHPDMDG